MRLHGSRDSGQQARCSDYIREQTCRMAEGATIQGNNMDCIGAHDVTCDDDGPQAPPQLAWQTSIGNGREFRNRIFASPRARQNRRVEALQQRTGSIASTSREDPYGNSLSSERRGLGLNRNDKDLPAVWVLLYWISGIK